MSHPLIQTIATRELTVEATSITVDKPTGTVESNLLFALISGYRANSNALHADPVPSGWTKHYHDTYALGYGRSEVILAYKVAGASEGSEYTFSFGGNTVPTGKIFRITGFDPDNIIQASSHKIGDDDSQWNSDDCVATSITATADNLVIYLGCGGRDHVSVVPSIASPSGMTDRGALSSTKLDSYANYRHAQRVASEEVGAGATGTRTGVNTEAQSWQAHLIAINPSPAVSPPTLVSAATNTAGTVVTVTFSKAMADPVGKHAEFSFKVGATARTFSAAALDAVTTKINLAVSGDAIAYGNVVTVSYTKGTVESDDGAELQSFTDQSVTNNIPDPTKTNIQTSALGVATVDLPNGSYSYRATKADKDPVEGLFTVAGSAKTIDISMITIDDALDPDGDMPDTIADVTPDYFVKTGGSDAADGLSDATAWATLAKVNSFAFNAGDVVAFNRGDEFYGSLVPSRSGTSANKITFSAYGTGAKPVIHGWKTLTSWTDEGGNIYSKVDATLAVVINILSLDGAVRHRGRYPLKDAGGDFYKGWHPITSFSGTSSVTHALIDSAAPDLVGGQIIIAKNDWILEPGTITAQSGETISYTGTSSTTLESYAKFFVQNHLNCLTSHGDWMYDAAAKKVYIYLDTAASNYTIKVSSVDTIADVDNKTDLVFNNLSIQGSNTAGMRFRAGSLRHKIEGCDILFSGRDGVTMRPYYWPGYITFDNCYFQDTQFYGIDIYQASYVDVTNCVFRRTYLDPGNCRVGSLVPGAISTAAHSGDYYNFTGNRMYYNGAKGIEFRGSHFFMENNIVYKYALTSTDCGAFYAWGGENGSGVPFTNRVISKNIINNLDWEPPINDGAYRIDQVGIYLDDYTPNVIFNDNVIIGARFGVFNSTAIDCSGERNIFYKCQDGMYMLEFFGTPPITGWNFQNNIIYQHLATADFQAIYINNLQGQNVRDYGTINNNYYILPTIIAASGGNYVRFRSPGWGSSTYYDSLPDWVAAYGFDADTVGSPTASLVSELYYNPNREGNIVVNIGAAKIDKDGNALASEQTLAPFEYLLVLE